MRLESKRENVVKSPSDSPSHRKSGTKPPGKLGRPARSSADRALMRQIGERLRWVREELQLTQQQVADMIGLDHSTWCYYEQGKRFPDPLRMPAICARLNVDTDFLLRGSLNGVERNLAILLAARHPELAGSVRIAPDKNRTRSS